MIVIFLISLVFLCFSFQKLWTELFSLVKWDNILHIGNTIREQNNYKKHLNGFMKSIDDKKKNDLFILK